MAASSERLDGLTGHARHQGVVARVAELKRSSSLDDTLDAVVGPPLLLVLDGIQDPHNLGACLRVADAAGVSAVVAPKDRAVGLNATAAKVASGAAETVPYFPVTNLARTLRELKERSIWIVGTDEGAKDDVFTADFPEAVAWVLGAEGEGMRRIDPRALRFPRPHSHAGRRGESQRIRRRRHRAVRIGAPKAIKGNTK